MAMHMGLGFALTVCTILHGCLHGLAWRLLHSFADSATAEMTFSAEDQHVNATFQNALDVFS